MSVSPGVKNDEGKKELEKALLAECANPTFFFTKKTPSFPSWRSQIGILFSWIHFFLFFFQ